jgi:Xaa-Pro dipeptidase
MWERGLGALVVVGPEDVYYLTGLDYQGYFAFTALLVTLDGPPVLVTRAMEAPTVRDQAPGCAHVPYGDGDDPAAALLGAIRERVAGGTRAGLEQASMFFPPAVAARLRRARTGPRWRDASGLVAGVRAVKSPEEVGHTRAAAALSDHALAAGIAAVRRGAPQTAVAAEVYAAMISGGGEPPGFAPLIRPLALLPQEHVTWWHPPGPPPAAAPPATAAPSDPAPPADRGLFFELSASVRHYHAPLSRTVYLGRPPDGAVRAHAAAAAGLAAIENALRPGVPMSAVYDAWRAAVDAVCPQGGATPRHHCGYLVGIGFPPSWTGGTVRGMRPGDDTPVEAGMTFHALSWVQRPAGHVMSDTLLATPEGGVSLTATPRDLIVVAPASTS